MGSFVAGLIATYFLTRLFLLIAPQLCASVIGLAAVHAASLLLLSGASYLGKMAYVPSALTAILPFLVPQLIWFAVDVALEDRKKVQGRT